MTPGSTSVNTGDYQITPGTEVICPPSSIVDLFPTEVLSMISDNVQTTTDLVSLLRSCKTFKDVVYPRLYTNLFISTATSDPRTCLEEHGDYRIDFIDKDGERWTVINGIKKFHVLLRTLSHATSPLTWRQFIKRVIFDHLFFSHPRISVWNPLDPLRLEPPHPMERILTEALDNHTRISFNFQFRLLLDHNITTEEFPDGFKEVIYATHTHSRLTSGQPTHVITPSYKVGAEHLKETTEKLMRCSNVKLGPLKVYTQREVIEDYPEFYKTVAKGLAHLMNEEESSNLEFAQLNVFDFTDTNSIRHPENHRFILPAHSITNISSNGSTTNRYAMNLEFQRYIKRLPRINIEPHYANN